MTLQTSIENRNMASGVVGEFSRNDNSFSFTGVLESSDESQNEFGVGVSFTLPLTGDDTFAVGNPIGTTFAGILCCPKSATRPDLEASPFVKNGTFVEIATRGFLSVNLNGGGSRGDLVYCSQFTGELLALSPDSAPTAGLIRVPGGLVTREAQDSGIAEIYIDIAGSVHTPV